MVNRRGWIRPLDGLNFTLNFVLEAVASCYSATARMSAPCSRSLFFGLCDDDITNTLCCLTVVFKGWKKIAEKIIKTDLKGSLLV